MNLSHRILFLIGALVISGLSRVTAQSMDNPGTEEETAPAGSTVITSDELNTDQEKHIAVFTGNVVVVGNAFNMKCKEMTVYFAKDNKVDHIIATGNVVVTQPERISHSDQVEYFRDEDKFVLTGQPTILDHKNQIWAPTIIIYRTKQAMTTQGPTRTILVQDKVTPSETESAPATDKQ